MKTIINTLFISIIILQVNADARMTHYEIVEICQTQVSFDAKITVSDSQYVDLEDYPIATEWAGAVFLSSAKNNVGQIFDCEDIAYNAKMRFIMAMGEYLIPQGNTSSGIPIGILIFGNSLHAHVINIIIHDREVILYDIGMERIWTTESIEDAEYSIIEIQF